MKGGDKENVICSRPGLVQSCGYHGDGLNAVSEANFAAKFAVKSLSEAVRSSKVLF